MHHRTHTLLGSFAASLHLFCSHAVLFFCLVFRLYIAARFCGAAPGLSPPPARTARIAYRSGLHHARAHTRCHFCNSFSFWFTHLLLFWFCCLNSFWTCRAAHHRLGRLHAIRHCDAFYLGAGFLFAWVATRSLRTIAHSLAHSGFTWDSRGCCLLPFSLVYVHCCAYSPS